MKPSYRELPADRVTIKEAAAILQVTTQALYQALAAGRLPYEVIRGRKCLRRLGLEREYWGTTQRLADRPQAQHHRPTAAAPLAELSDAELAAYCDAHLGDEALAAAMEPINQWADSLQEPDWERIAALANASLDCASWGPPPWAPEQWVTLSMVLSLAEEAAADG